MSILISTLAFCLVGLFASSVPAYLAWRRELRDRRLAEQRLCMARAVTSMEQLLLSGNLRPGHVCHDEVFEMMRHVQAFDHYPIRWDFWTPPSREGVAFAKRLKADLADPECPARDALAEFVGAYFRAFRFRHAWRFRAYIVYCMGSLALLLLVRGALRSILHLDELRRQARSKLRERLIASTYPAVYPQGLLNFA